MTEKQVISTDLGSQLYTTDCLIREYSGYSTNVSFEIPILKNQKVIMKALLLLIQNSENKIPS